MSMFGDNLSVKVTARTQSFERSISSAREKLGDLRSSALSASGAMQVLGGRADEAGDEISETGRESGRTSRSLFGLAAAAGSAKISFGSLSVATAVSLVPSLLTLATVIAPVAAAFVATAAGAAALAAAFGGLVGAGLLSWGQQLADQMEGVNSATEALAKIAGRLKDQLADVIAPLGDAFVPLLQEATLALPVVVEEMVNAVGSLQEFQQGMRRFGSLMARVLPALTAFIFDLARTAMPVMEDFITFMMENGGTAFDDIMASVRALKPEFNAFLDAFIAFLPVLLKFGTHAADVVIPAFTSLIRLSTGFMETINGLPPMLRDAAIAGMILAPVLVTLTLKIAGLVSLLTGGGGLVAAIGGSGGIAAALTALTGPVGIAIAAIGLLAAAWHTDLGGMRTATKQTVSEINGMLSRLGRGEGAGDVSAVGGGDSFTASLVKDKIPKSSVTRKRGQEAAVAANNGYLKKLKELQGKDTSGTFIDPATFKSQGQTAGQQFAQGFQQGAQKPIKSMTPAIMDALKAGAPGFTRKAGEDPTKFEKKPTEITPELVKFMAKNGGVSPEKLGVSQKQYQALLSRAGLGGSSGGMSRAASSPSGGSSQAFAQSSMKIKNVTQTFSKAVDKFARAVENMEVVVSLDDEKLDATVRETANDVVTTRERRTTRNSGTTATPR